MAAFDVPECRIDMLRPLDLAALLAGVARLLVDVDDRRTTRVTMRAALLGLSASR